MDIKDAIQLIESDRLNELDIEVLWQIKDVLSSSNDPRALQYLVIFQNTAAGQSLSQKSLEMQTLINNNVMAVKAIEQGMGLVAKKNKSPDFSTLAIEKLEPPVQKALLPVFNFYKRVEIENKTTAEPVKAEKLFAQNAEIARLSALKDIYLNKNFSNLKPEEQKESYIKAFVMAMEENVFVMVSNQIVENVARSKHSNLSVQEKAKIANEVEKRFEAIINPNNQAKFKLSNVNIIGTQVAEINRLDVAAEQIKEHTTSKVLAEEVKAQDKKLSKVYPDSMMVLRPLAKAPNMGVIAGSVGLSSFAATNIAQNVHKYNPTPKDKSISLFGFLKEQPKALKAFKDNLVVSLKNVYRSIVTFIDLGYVNNKISLSWKKIANHFSKPVNNAKLPENSPYKNLTQQLVNSNLSVMSRQVSRALNEKNDEKCLFIWKEFHRNVLNSPIGKVLNAERCLLVPEDPKDYTKEVKIVLPHQQKESKTEIDSRKNTAKNKEKSANKFISKLLKPLQIAQRAVRSTERR